MIGMNIQELRRRHDVTQEELAEKLDVSRQTIAKWERGESAPDINSCIRIADLFNVTVDELINYDQKKSREEGLDLGVPPKGKYFFGAVKVGERGQVVIPQRARKIFHIEPGDQILVLGDENQGLALIPKKGIWELTKAIFHNRDKIDDDM